MRRRYVDQMWAMIVLLALPISLARAQEGGERAQHRERRLLRSEDDNWRGERGGGV